MTIPDDAEDRAWLRRLALDNARAALHRHNTLRLTPAFDATYEQRIAYYADCHDSWHAHRDLSAYGVYLAAGFPCDLEETAAAGFEAIPDTLRPYVTPTVLLYAAMSGNFEPETSVAARKLQQRIKTGRSTRQLTADTVHTCAKLLWDFAGEGLLPRVSDAEAASITEATAKPEAILSVAVRVLAYVAAEREEDVRTLHLLLMLAENRGSRAATAYYRRAKQLLPHIDKASHRFKPAALKQRREEQHEYLARLTGAKE